MAEYINEEPCEFIYNITAVERVVDGDTIDAVFDLGFDVRICIESACLELTLLNHEREIWKKSSTVNFPRQLSNHGYIGRSYQTEMILKYNVDVQSQIAEASSVEY